jgi:F-type H+-transporting ATPase subunit gamma
MASAREIKKRIRSVKNISQITRALEAVSASRVRRAQARVLASRAYAQKAWEILLNVQSTATVGIPLHPLLTAREDVKQVMIVLITSDRGLAAAYNTNIIRVAQRFAERLGKPVRYVTIGRKGRDSMVRQRANIIAEFSNLPSEPKIADISPITRLAIDEFLSGTVDDVFIAYTDFVNTLTQRPRVLRWLPLMPYETEDKIAAELLKDVPRVSQNRADYEFEPDASAILEEIVPRFTELQLYQALLESLASEHSARMVAMRNASDNAGQLIEDLTLVYNKARQSAITSEILDIVGGAEALQATLDAAADQIEAAALASQAPVKANGNGSGYRTTDVRIPSAAAQVAVTPSSVAEAVAEAVSEQDVQLAPTQSITKRDGSDDLTIIEGIGPKMSAALIAAGIDSFAKLADATKESLAAAIESAGMRFAPSMNTWAEQAGYLARGDREGFNKFVAGLSGGRRS